MRLLLIILFICFGKSLFAQGVVLKILNVPDTTNKNQMLVKIILKNNSNDTLLFPENPQFGYEADSTIDMFFKDQNCETDSILYFQNTIHYSNIIISSNNIKILPKQEYSFIYNTKNLYPVMSNHHYKFVLFYNYKWQEKKILLKSNAINTSG